jgi:hypothetical protein
MRSVLGTLIAFDAVVLAGCTLPRAFLILEGVPLLIVVSVALGVHVVEAVDHR